MTILTWSIRLLIIAFLGFFAARNADPVSLHLFWGEDWQAPLVVVLLVVFFAGLLVGALSLVGVIYRQHREIARLRKECVRVPVNSDATTTL